MSQLLLPIGPLPIAWRVDGLHLLWSRPKRSYHSPITTMSVALNEEEATSQEEPLPSCSSEAIAGPCRSSMLPMALQRGPLVPLYVPQLEPPAEFFRQVNLKGSHKMYICGQCKKNTSNWDSMVSHCLQEHLGVHLVCPQCEISYSYLSWFCLHGRGIHNLLFY